MDFLYGCNTGSDLGNKYLQYTAGYGYQWVAAAPSKPEIVKISKNTLLEALKAKKELLHKENLEERRKAAKKIDELLSAFQNNDLDRVDMYNSIARSTPISCVENNIKQIAKDIRLVEAVNTNELEIDLNCTRGFKLDQLFKQYVIDAD